MRVLLAVLGLLFAMPLGCLWFYVTGGILRNLTTNERHNRRRYPHFKSIDGSYVHKGGRILKVPATPSEASASAGSAGQPATPLEYARLETALQTPGLSGSPGLSPGFSPQGEGESESPSSEQGAAGAWAERVQDRDIRGAGLTGRPRFWG